MQQTGSVQFFCLQVESVTVTWDNCLLHVKYFQLNPQCNCTDSTMTCKKQVGTCLLHVKYFQFSAVAVQIQLAKNCWNLFVACQIFSVFRSGKLTDSTWGKKTVGTCLLHVKYFQFSKQQQYRVNLQVEKNGWNLFVACQIFSA